MGQTGHTQYWRRDGAGPVAPVTLRTARTVAVVVENQQAGDRLGEVVSLVESDPRVQTVYVLAKGSRFSPSAKYSAVMGSMYVRSASSGSVMMVAGLLFTRMTPKPSSFSVASAASTIRSFVPPVVPFIRDQHP